MERAQVRVLGIVQGVGFRPFIYRLSTLLELKGWVRNDGGGVTIEVEGDHNSLLEFLSKLRTELPPAAFIYAIDSRFLNPVGYQSFEIVESVSTDKPLVWVLPDLATCSQCKQEILDPANRRYVYAFTNCTHCGPRFTIIQELPYDRPKTTMNAFQMCTICKQEYQNPIDRRFHAQPNACPDCGPQLSFHDSKGKQLLSGVEALKEAEQQVLSGKILAMKGIGGYQLILDARNETAVVELRKRKKRQNKPFAVMYPNIDFLKRHVDVPPFVEPVLNSTQAPIILLNRTQLGSSEIAPSVAPQSPYLGVFLPYSPLHHLLLNHLKIPLVATSANITDEPIEFEDNRSFSKLGSICDFFLVHNRSIAHHADDSVVHVIKEPQAKVQMLRRARGYTPFPILAPCDLPAILALGGHLNSTFAMSRGREIILSQHIGDLEGYETREVFKRTLDHFLKIYKIEPGLIVHDLHPDYFTTRFAEEFHLPTFAVQHHHAHLAACVLENQVEEPVLGLTWDGTGFGTDRTIWGGEFLFGDASKFQRAASLFPFALPGGERAIKNTWRTALSLLFEAYGPELPTDLELFKLFAEWKSLLQIIQKPQFSPVTTSMGRLFDGMSALLGLSYYNSHQAEAAQMLEYAAWRNTERVKPYEMPIVEGDPLRIDWRPTIRAIVEQMKTGVRVELISAAFHETLVESAMDVIQRMGNPAIAMAGGVFCNRYLTEKLLIRCRQKNVKAFVHSQLPPTDGSLAAGQLWVAAHR